MYLIVTGAFAPRRFVVRVRDNPNGTNNSHATEAPVVVNLVGPDNLVVLTVENATPEQLQRDRATIARLVEDKTGLLVGVDRIDSRRLLTPNNTLEIRHYDSDVWLYAVDPESDSILTRNSSLLRRRVFAPFYHFLDS